MKKSIFLVIGLCTILLVHNGFSQSIVASFENLSDLQNTHTTTGVDVSQSTDFVALGAYSCKVVFPENGGKFYLDNIETSFLGNIEASGVDLQESLLYFVWTNENSKVNILIEDAAGQVFIKEFTLDKGANHIQLSLSEVKNIDFKKIKSIGISTKKPDILYLDYIAFDQHQPVIDKLGRWEVGYAMDIETEHYPWGADFVNGPIKSYSISPVFDGRGIIELAQRLDLDFDVTSIGRTEGAEKYGFGDFYMRRSPGHGGDSTTFNLAHKYIADELLFSPEYDVIIWPGLHKWETYPKHVRNALLDRVNNGAGLILLYPISDKNNSNLWDISPLKSIEAGNAQPKIKDTEILSIPEKFDESNWIQTKSHYITRGVAFDAFPYGNMGIYPFQENGGEVLLESANGSPVLAVSNYGKGRVVAMAYPERGFLPRMDDPWKTGLNYPYWEYIWSMVARSVVWASNNEPDNYINTIERTPDGVSVKLTNDLDEASLIVQVLDDFGITEEEKIISLDAKQSVIEVSFQNMLSAGNHIVNVSLKGDKGIYDWYSLMFQTDRVTEIISIKNDKSEIPVGENVQSSVLLKSESLVKGVLVSRLFDNYNRLVDEQKQEFSFQGEKKLEVAFNSKNIITNLGKSEYVLHVNGQQVDHKVKEHFFLQPRIWDDYDVTMYHFGPNPVPGVWPAIDRQLRELNVTTLAAYTVANSKHANYKVQAQTRIQGVESPDSGPDLKYYEDMLNKYLKTHDKFLLVRKYGLKDTVYLNSVRKDLTAQLKEWKKFSPSAYYIYEEPSITRYDGALDLDFSDISLNAMREWLQRKYSSLKALNEQWGTDFANWTDVVPDDTFEAQARGNYSSWADHRSFMEVCWADQFKFVKEIVDEVDPGGLVQLSGTQATSSHNGYDYSLINPHIGQMNPYNIDNQLEYHMTFNPDLKISGQAGYGALGKGVLYDYYHHLFLKETGGSYVFWQVSSMNPDLRICQAGMDMKEGFDEMLKRGIGRLIGNYEPENELKIAIHYSYPSIHAAWIVDGKIVPKTGDNESNTLRQYNKNRDGWVKILHDMGIGFNFIAYSSIEDGGLVSNGYNALILPMSYAISDKEVAQIEAFVKAGGILIADALPGVMDDHNKFRSKRALANVFGIKDRKYTREELITPVGEVNLKIKKADALLKENDKSKLLFNEFGEGSAYLLNYFMDDYAEEKANRKNDISLSRIRNLFDKAELVSELKITKPDGVQENGVEKYAFSHENSSTGLLGILPGRVGGDREVKLKFENPIHLYDIRNKKYLGEASEFNINVFNTVPEMFGLLSGKIESINIDAPSIFKLGEKMKIDFEILGVNNFYSVAAIEVINPKGEVVSYYSKNCDIKNNKGTYSFDLALNDLSGRWKIRLTEVISGMEKIVVFDVK